MNNAPSSMVSLLISGDIGIGKTSLLRTYTEWINKQCSGLKLDGTLSLRIPDGRKNRGYSIIRLSDKIRADIAVNKLLVEENKTNYSQDDLFELKMNPASIERPGSNGCKYYFIKGGFESANDWYLDITSNLLDIDILIIDDIGPLEFNGKGIVGIMNLLKNLTDRFSGILIVAVRGFLMESMVIEFPYDWTILELNQKNSSECMKTLKSITREKYGRE